MFYQSLSSGSKQAQETLQRLTEFLEYEGNEGRVAPMMQKRILGKGIFSFFFFNYYVNNNFVFFLFRRFIGGSSRLPDGTSGAVERRPKRTRRCHRTTSKGTRCGWRQCPQEYCQIKPKWSF